MNSLPINYFNLICIALADVLLYVIASVYIKDMYCKLALFVSVFIATIFSAIGIILKFRDNSVYLAPFLLFITALVMSYTLTILVDKKKKDRTLYLQTMFVNKYGLFKSLGIFCLLMQMTNLVYPQVIIGRLFQPFVYFLSSNTFNVRIEQGNDPIYSFIEILRVFTLPFFFIWLYKMKRKPVSFIALFLFYQYISYVRYGYVSRNDLIVYFIFIMVYLYKNKYVNKLQLFSILGVTLVIFVPLMNMLFDVRSGISYKSLSMKESIVRFLQQEALGPSLLYKCEQFASSNSFFMMLLRWITLPIPFLPNVDFPILVREFTTSILGINYGEYGYYIMLPGSFGEGMMMFSRWYVWIYGAFIGFFAGYVCKVLKRYEFLEYWLLYFILDYARAFRGGIQTFLSATYHSAIGILIIVLIFKFLGKKQTADMQSNNQISEN